MACLLKPTASVVNSAARSSIRAYASHAPSFNLSQAAGIKIAASDDGKPTSAISVIIKAGSRYEPAPGMAHVLKNLVFKGTQKRSALSLVREAEHLGGVLTSSLSREHLVLTAEFLRGDEAYFAEVLGDVLTSSRFAKHEYDEEVVPQVASEYEQATRDPSALAFDLAHQLAFRKGLGNSLFATPHTSIAHNDAVSYAISSFAKPSEMAVVATGVSGQALTGLVSDFFVAKSAEAVAAHTTSVGSTTYYGGEIRVPAAGNGFGHFLLGFKGASRQSPEYTVLQYLLGGQSSIKWSKGTSPLSQLETTTTSARAFNLPYSDAGLFGIYVTAPTSEVEAVAGKAIAELQKVAKSADAAAVKKAIAMAKFSAAALIENSAERTEALGSQVLDNGAVGSLEDLFASLDKVTPAKVAEAAALALKSKPVTVAIGDVHKLPYADAFKL